MVQVKGMERWLTQRFNSDFDSSVKYSTLWPSRMDSPSLARRAMPTSRGWAGLASAKSRRVPGFGGAAGRVPAGSGGGSSGREDIYSPFVRLRYSCLRRLSRRLGG